MNDRSKVRSRPIRVSTDPVVVVVVATVVGGGRVEDNTVVVITVDVTLYSTCWCGPECCCGAPRCRRHMDSAMPTLPPTPRMSLRPTR
jgi:hypothetical protein